MSNYLTKSLTVEFSNNPKLARWHLHDKVIYKRIQKAQYGAMDGIAVGQSTEDVFLKLYRGKNIITIDTQKIDPNDWHTSYHKLTQAVLDVQPAVIYQWAFTVDDLFTKSDFLVLNDEGQYDLVEVKSKNSIRKNTKAAPFLEDLIYDISFQRYVLEKTLGDKFSGKCFFGYINKEYIRYGEISVKDLTILEDVTEALISLETLDSVLDIMRKHLSLDQKKFEKLYPYDGSDHMCYFGEPKPKNSVWSIPRMGKKVMDFYPDKTKLVDFEQEDILTFYNKKGETTKSSKFLELWLQWETTINVDAIQERFDKELKYPLYFYDYETVARPVPLLEKTSPWQQVIVQYSLHKIDEDGNVSHKEAILKSWERDNKRIVDQLIHDFEGGNGTYIVWYKWFENTRNKETALMYSAHKWVFEKVNNNTFDLMELFSDQLYFDRRFQGSSSIKKVLPVLTDISYEGLNVPNGGVAMELLRKIAQGILSDQEQKKYNTDLLEYCKQDTWAMVRIWEEVKKKL